MHVVGLLVTLRYYSDVLRWHNGERLRWHNSERLRLSKDEGLRVIARDVVEVCAVGDDCIFCHC